MVIIWEELPVWPITPPAGGMGYMVSWADVLRKICVIFEIVDSNAQVRVEKDVQGQAR